MLANGEAAVPGLASLPMAVVKTSPDNEPSFTYQVVAKEGIKENSIPEKTNSLTCRFNFIIMILI